MELRILGPLEVVGEDGAVVIDAPKERAVLEVLALRAGDVLPTDVLIEALWNVDPPRSAAKSLQSHISRLRHALPAELIATEPTGYRLCVDPEAVDAHRFERLVAAGRQALEGDDPRRAVALLEEALAQWRGAPLVDLAEGPFRLGQVARLDEVRAIALELRVDAHLGLGHHEMLVAELEVLTADDPLRERRWGQLMLALHRSGRRADALATYQRLRVLLRDELGIDPSHDLRELEGRILREDPTLELPPPAPPRLLPTPLTSFVGRERLVRDVRKLLHADRLVTLVGPGGVGKSRMAVEVADQDADRWPDGVWWVDLAHVAEAGSLGAHLVRALGVTVAPGLSSIQALRWFLAPRALLLVADNAEGLTGELGPQLTELLEAAADLTVLVTSRIPLEVPGEQQVAVPALEVPAPDGDDPLGTEAMRLFLDRLADHDAPIPGADDLATIGELCRLVDGLPLGIELLAGRVGRLSPGPVLAELDDRVRLLGEQLPGRDRRHASLEAVLASTVALHGVDTRAGLARLSVFPVDFDMEAAQVVAGPEAAAGFDGLVASGLLVPVGPSQDEQRYRLLDPTRAYAATLLDLDDAAAALHRHAEHYRDLVRRAGRAMEGPEEAVWLERLRREDANVRVALRWWTDHDPGGTLAFANAVGRAWTVWGDFDEAIRLLEGMATTAADIEADPLELAWVHLRSGWPRFLTGDVAGGLEAMEAAGDLFEAADDPAGLNRALAGQAHMTLLATGDTDAALERYQQAVAAARRAGIATLTAWTLAEAAQALVLADRTDVEVDAMIDEAEAIFAAADDHVGLGHVAMDRMFAAYAREDFDGANAAIELGLRHSRMAGDHVHEQVLLLAQGMAEVHRGRPDDGAPLIAEAVRLAYETHNLLQLGVALQGVAVHAAVVGDPVRAARLWGAGGRLAPVWPLVQRRYGELLAHAREQLGPQFAEETARGAALPMDEIVALGLALPSASGGH